MNVLILEPQSILAFRPPFEHSKCCINVTNPTPYGICFKMKTTACHRYCVKPRMGRIPPYSKEVITVKLKASKGDSEDKFKLLSFVSKNESISAEEAWKNYDESDATKYKFIVVFLPEEISDQSKLSIKMDHIQSQSTNLAKLLTQKNEESKEIIEKQIVKEKENNLLGLKLVYFIMIVLAVLVYWLQGLNC